MEYRNELITIASLREEAANHRKRQPITEPLTTSKDKRKEECDLESQEDNRLLTTKEAIKILGCSKTTLWSYAREGILTPWQRKKKGLTRWLISELRKI
jgi:predicted DNA-binding transcriptional regulator AlpA